MVVSYYTVLAPYPPPCPPLKWPQLLKVDCRPTCKALIENAERWRTSTTTTMDPKNQWRTITIMDPRKIFQGGKNCAWVGGGGGPWGLQRHHGRDVWRQGGLPMTTWWHHLHHHRHQCAMCSLFSINLRATEQAQTYLKIWVLVSLYLSHLPVV